MQDDPIVTEVRQVRQAHAARYDYDLRAIYAALKEQEKSSSLEIVSFPPKRIAPSIEDYEAARVPLQVLREEIENPYGRQSGQDQDESADQD